MLSQKEVPSIVQRHSRTHLVASSFSLSHDILRSGVDLRHKGPLLVRGLDILGNQDILGLALILKGLKTGKNLVIRKTQFKRLEEGLFGHEVQHLLFMVSHQQLFHLPWRL